MSEKYDAIKAELDQIKAQDDEVHANKNKLYDEMRELKAQVDDLWVKKKDSTKNHREANDRYYKKVAEERARRQERFAAERATAELEKRKEIAERLREEAAAPAFQAEIEDAQTLIDALSAKINVGGTITISTQKLNLSSGEGSGVTGLPKLEVRAVEANTDGLVARKKKGEEEENYFVAKKKKGGVANGKASTLTDGDSTPAQSANTKLNLPYSTLSALLQLSIPPPSSTSDIPRTIEDLKTKKAWFEANQARVTEENVAKADAEIKRLEASGAKSPGANSSTGEYPLEPVPTPAVPVTRSVPVAADTVEEKLEEVKEAIEA